MFKVLFYLFLIDEFLSTMRDYQIMDAKKCIKSQMFLIYNPTVYMMRLCGEMVINRTCKR